MLRNEVIVLISKYLFCFYKIIKKQKQLIENHYVHWTKLKVCRVKDNKNNIVFGREYGEKNNILGKQRGKVYLLLHFNNVLVNPRLFNIE